MNVKELKQLAKNHGLRGYSKLRKAELIKLLLEHQVEVVGTKSSIEHVNVQPSDILYFYNSSTREQNDSINKLRERILLLLVNEKNFVKQFRSSVYYSKWKQLLSNLMTSITSMIPNNTTYTDVRLVLKAGRRFNYDFDMNVIHEGILVSTIKLEFKYGVSIFNYPQFLSVYCSSNQLLDVSYQSYWYDNYLDSYVELIESYTDKQLVKPSFSVFLKNINVTSYKHSFFRTIRDVKNDPLASRLNRRLDRIVNQSILTYLANNSSTCSREHVELLFAR